MGSIEWQQHPALLERKDGTLGTWYCWLYAPRAGGAYDSHHRTAGIAGEKGIELSLEEVDILAGQSRTPEFLAKNSSGGVPVLELDDGSYLSESVAICRYLEGLHPEPNLLGRDLREQAEIERWNRRMELELFAAIGRTVQNTSPIFQGRFKQFPDYGEAQRTAVHQRLERMDRELNGHQFVAGEPLHNRRHHGVGGNRYRGPFGRHKNSSGARLFDPLARASVEPSKRQGVTLRQLEEENSKLRKIVADLSLDKGISGRICLRSAKDAKDAESFERAHTRSRRSTTRRHERWRAPASSIMEEASENPRPARVLQLP